MDVKSAFLNGVLQEEVYVEQPLGFVLKGHERKVLHHVKALYGLRQAPRAWYSKLDESLIPSASRGVLLSMLSTSTANVVAVLSWGFMWMIL